jgi:hypothetical protein
MEDKVDLYFMYTDKINKVLDQSKILLNDLLDRNQFINPKCVIFDIDDTLVTNNNIPITNVINFYNYIRKELKLSTVIITARRKTSEYHTKKLLENLKIDDYDHLFMRSNYYIKNISFYKYEIRRCLSEKYDIVANVGNYYTDFFGGHNGIIIKIPTIVECIDQII